MAFQPAPERVGVSVWTTVAPLRIWTDTVALSPVALPAAPDSVGVAVVT